MSWIISSGLLVNRQKGKVLYPWEYSLHWDISNKEIRIVSINGDVITKCYDYEVSFKQLSDWQGESEVWREFHVEIESDILPGCSEYRLVNDELTNGVVGFKLAKCELADVDEAHFGLMCNGVRYLIKNESSAKQHLDKLIQVFDTALRGAAPVNSEATPGSSDFLRVVAWVYCLISAAGGFFLATEGAVAIGIGVGVSSFLVLAFALAIATINDNFHNYLAGRT